MKKILTHICVVCVIMMAISCGEDRTYQYEEKTQHNHWIHELMSDQYLWADTVARMELAWKDYFATPSDFLSKLKSKSGHSDSWSYVEVDTIVSDSHERGYFNHINSYGLDFTMMTDPTGRTTKSMLRVLTVYPNSPADRAGLLRGDFISSVDGYKISSNNISKMQKGTARQLEVCHIAVNEEDGSFYWKDTVDVSMQASEYVEDVAFPVSSMINAEGVRVGYLMCTRLLPYATEQNTNHQTAYADALDDIMKQMKSAAVEELVLDLRLCNYGTIEMAQRLASYVVCPEARSGSFVKTFWNEQYADNNQTLPYDANVDNLGLNRLYVLTSKYTQGAAEWLIHALQHSMGEENVVLIGTATKGQNVMTQEVGSQYGVHLFPVVAYVADGAGEYDYGSISPTVVEDEFAYLALGEYGSTDEILLYRAIQKILGIGQDDSGSEENSDKTSETGEVEQ